MTNFSDAECLANYVKLKELFASIIPDSQRFNVVYGYGMDVGMMNYVVVRTTTTTYSSYAIGYNVDEIVIIPIDIDLEHYGKPFFLKKDEIKKSEQNRMTKDWIIWDKQFPKTYIQFIVPDLLNDDEDDEDDDDVVLPIKQEEEAKAFEKLFKEVYIGKQQSSNILQDSLQKVFSIFNK